MNKQKIENSARELQLKLWASRQELIGSKNVSPLSVLEPQLAARLLGVNYKTAERIMNPGFGTGGIAQEYAGQIDRSHNIIVISKRFPEMVKRFTGAHEIGHFQLHKGTVHHRDLPIKGLNLNLNRSIEEREADYFAACFLMPKKQVITAVQTMLRGELPLIMNDHLAHLLHPSDPEAILRANSDSLEPYFSLASCRFLYGKPVIPLADQFMVSPQSMAIRLKELKIIRS